MKKQLTYSIADIIPYINWPYFYFAWQIKNKMEQQRLRSEAETILHKLNDHYHTYGLFSLLDANSDGDDILVGDIRIPMLRQQRVLQNDKPSVCLSDFIRPLSSGIKDKIGIFATTVDVGLETDFAHDDYQKMMVQLLADRLAEATAEKMHQEIRKIYWGYAPDENLSMAALLLEHYQGIRPAIGYPSLPDTSVNFIIDQILSLHDIGIRLTESGAMKPHASVSGFMFSHPKAFYFALGKIGEDQLHDYALRRGIPVELMRKFLAGALR